MRWKGVCRLAGAAGLLLAAAPAAASSYLLSEGHMYYRAQLGQSQADAAWDAEGRLAELDCTAQRTTLDNTLEWGASYWHTLYGQFGLSESRCGERHHAGVGDITVGARGRLKRYENFRAWEIDATIPLQRGAEAVGCGAFGLGASLERSDRSPYLTVAYGAGLQLWQAPLAHRVRVQAQASGPLGLRRVSPWSWQAGLSANAPVVDRPVDPEARLDDCGTQARQLRAGTGLRYRYSRAVTLSCSLGATLAGADTHRSRTLSCGFSHLWD
jgi:hypothetical protein